MKSTGSGKSVPNGDCAYVQVLLNREGRNGRVWHRTIYVDPRYAKLGAKLVVDDNHTWRVVELYSGYGEAWAKKWKAKAPTSFPDVKRP